MLAQPKIKAVRWYGYCALPLFGIPKHVQNDAGSGLDTMF
jgi:hypothetical protein